MERTHFFEALCLGTLLTLAGCAAQPVSPSVIYAEPVFDKFGNPSCRPPDMPIGGAYTQDLPLCAAIASASSVPAMSQ